MAICAEVAEGGGHAHYSEFFPCEEPMLCSIATVSTDEIQKFDHLVALGKLSEASLSGEEKGAEETPEDAMFLEEEGGRIRSTGFKLGAGSEWVE